MLGVRINIMPEEQGQNTQGPENRVEDVFSDIEEPAVNEVNKGQIEDSVQTPDISPEREVQKEKIDISESSIGQEQQETSQQIASTRVERGEPIQETDQVQQKAKVKESVMPISKMEPSEKKEINLSNFLFYLILALIILIGAFAVWTLVF